MYLLENPVLQRELLVNLRMRRGFVLMLVYQTALATIVYVAWPSVEVLDLSTPSEDARKLVDLFFLGQYLLASLVAPSLAAGAITGEKERKTYEMLLASPLRPSAIVLGKLIASLAYVVILIVASLPIIMLCLPLGGVSPYEVFAAYLGMIVSAITFGAIGIACSSVFQRTIASLVVSYLVILPLALSGVLFWYLTRTWGEFRLVLTVTALPGVAAAICLGLYFYTCARLLHPPDVGSEGSDVVNLEDDAERVVGLVIQRDQYPDKLFAPAKRKALLEDGANPVYEKEIRGELFSQGTLMLRLVIQVSMLLAIVLMAPTLFIWPQLAPWYITYVLIFNMLVGPVFSAGSITGERERQTLELLLTTSITPWQILSGKLRAGLRVSSMLTILLLWPLLLACILVSSYWNNLRAVTAFTLIVLLACLTTALVALLCSILARKTTVSLMTAYLLITLLFCAPLAADFFARTFPVSPPIRRVVQATLVASPFFATFQVPRYRDLQRSSGRERRVDAQTWTWVRDYAAFTAVLAAALLIAIPWLFSARWRFAP